MQRHATSHLLMLSSWQDTQLSSMTLVKPRPIRFVAVFGIFMSLVSTRSLPIADSEQLFLRYFNTEHAQLVGDMFRAIADIPYDEELTPAQIDLLLLQSPPQLSEKYLQLSIFCPGDHPYLVKNYNADQDGCNSERKPAAYTVAEGSHGADGYISICPKAFLDPSLQDIESPPDWARDSNMPSTFKAGYGCANLGVTDSSYMISTGATVLHELFHWEGLFADVPNYYDIIPYTDGDNGIEDLGEGAYFSNQVNVHATTSENSPTNNADSYVFYA